MDNRFPFFSRQPLQPTEQPSVEPQQQPRLALTTETTWWMRLLHNPYVPLIALMGLFFFLGNQVGCVWQKRQNINRQIRNLEARHQETLRKADSLYANALRIDTSMVKQLSTLYMQLEKLNVKDNNLKVEIATTKVNLEKKSVEVSNKIKEHKIEVENRPKNVNDFGFIDDL
jgi:hypothetical protein